MVENILSLKDAYHSINNILENFFKTEEERFKEILKKIEIIQINSKKNPCFFSINGKSFLFKENFLSDKEKNNFLDKDASLSKEAIPLGEHYSKFYNKYINNRISVSIYYQELYNKLYYLNTKDNNTIYSWEFFLKFFPSYIINEEIHDEKILIDFFKSSCDLIKYKQILKILDSYEANKLIL